MALGDEDDIFTEPKRPWGTSTTTISQGANTLPNHGSYSIVNSPWTTSTPAFQFRPAVAPYRTEREAELERKVAQLEGWVERLLGILEGRGLAPVE